MICREKRADAIGECHNRPVWLPAYAHVRSVRGGSPCKHSSYGEFATAPCELAGTIRIAGVPAFPYSLGRPCAARSYCACADRLRCPWR